jgi:peptidoglycan LD-endopeptidase CwlK
MKVKIATRLPIKQAWLDEVTALIPGITFEVVTTDKQLSTWYNPTQKATYCTFESMRAIINDKTVQVRAFYMPYSELKALGITNHLALYDNSDRDDIFDFYVGLGDTLDPRARRNGFKSNFAWEFVHEILHGYEQNRGNEINAGDRTHDWEAKGQLKALLAENIAHGIELQKQQISLLQSLVAALTTQVAAMFKPKPVVLGNDLLPLVKRQVDKVLEDMAMLGHPMRVTQGFRSIEEQDKLYAQGRTTPGKIVTQAKGGQSFHNWGCAADFVFRNEGYGGGQPLWDTFGAIGKKHGFEWGNDWEGSFQDIPHLQMTLGYTFKDFQNNLVDYNKYK